MTSLYYEFEILKRLVKIETSKLPKSLDTVVQSAVALDLPRFFDVLKQLTESKTSKFKDGRRRMKRRGKD